MEVEFSRTLEDKTALEKHYRQVASKIPEGEGERKNLGSFEQRELVRRVKQTSQTRSRRFAWLLVLLFFLALFLSGEYLNPSVVASFLLGLLLGISLVFLFFLWLLKWATRIEKKSSRANAAVGSIICA
jgi:hypothetical protein